MNPEQKIGIILAAGKGTRLQSKERNKTSLEVAGKPLVRYGAELFAETADATVVVVGAFAESVKSALADMSVEFVEQSEQRGTGHAVQVAFRVIQEKYPHAQQVLVGYGDHLMFYTPKIVRELLQLQREKNAEIVLVTTHHENPQALAWGRIVRSEEGKVARIVEHKDASAEEREIKEMNAGFYCFSSDFLRETIEKLQPSPVTGEYYLTDLIAFAHERGGSVLPFPVPYASVGSGVNTLEQLEETQAILQGMQKRASTR